MNDRDQRAKRRARLRELRAQYEETARPPNGGEQPAEEAQTAPVGPARPRGGRGAGGRRRRQAAGGGGGGAGLRATLLKRLTETGEGDRLIPGTPVGEERLKQVLQLLRRRSESAEGRRAKRFTRALSYLTEAPPGDEVVAGVSVPRLKNFLKFLEGGGRPRGARRGPGARASAGADDAAVPQDELDEAFNELIDVTEQVNTELEQTRQRMKAAEPAHGESDTEGGTIEEPGKS